MVDDAIWTAGSGFDAGHSVIGLLLRLVSMVLACGLLLPVMGASAAEAPACRKVTLVDTGQPEVTASTALTGIVLAAIGYEVTIRDLGLTDAHLALALGEADIFLGARMAPEIDGLAPFLDSGAVEVAGSHLAGAGYGIATNPAGAALGLAGMQDLAAHHNALDGRIHGVAPGDAGNLAVMGMLATDQFGTGGFDLVESSERGLSAQLARAEERGRPLVVIARFPHPMNARFGLTYLTGGEEAFGSAPDTATIRTVTRRHLVTECANLGRFLDNLTIAPDLLTGLITAIQDDHQDPKAAAKAVLRAAPDQAAPWLAGVMAKDKPDAMASLRAALSATERL